MAALSATVELSVVAASRLAASVRSGFPTFYDVVWMTRATEDMPQGQLSAQRPRYQGKLELTWTNKDRSLLAHEDSSYEWVPQTDYRVAEVRLLREAGTVGEVRADGARTKDNLLIRGDALHALTSLLGISEYAREYAGRVKLVYIDPPFNTQQAFEHYDDALEHSVWLTMMRDRLEQVKDLLADDGSVWVHCDDSEQHRLRCVMDEVFGRDKFVATVLWQKRYSRDNRPAIGAVHDFIHVYALDPDGWKKVRNRLPRDAKTAKQYRNPNKPAEAFFEAYREWRVFLTGRISEPIHEYRFAPPDLHLRPPRPGTSVSGGRFAPRRSRTTAPPSTCGSCPPSGSVTSPPSAPPTSKPCGRGSPPSAKARTRSRT
jgi:DNA methylase